MGWFAEFEKLLFGSARKSKRKKKRAARKAKNKFVPKASYTQDELRELVRLGKANVKPHRKR